jgi:DNA-binding transcriptional MerR regulator
MATRLVGSGEAAKAVGVHVRTLQDWAKAGLVTPAGKTAGGHARWDVDDLRAQLRALERREE